MTLQIMMYHYVRPIKGSEYPNIKGIEIDDFSTQLDYFQKNYYIITAEEIIASIKSNSDIPSNSIWLTFDDGFSDHFKYVFPELRKRNLQGTFFPSVKSVIDKTLLDVHAIHFIIEKISNSYDLIKELQKECREEKIEAIKFNQYRSSIDKKSRHDDENTTFFKRMLQIALPIDVRTKIIKRIFENVLHIDEREIGNKLYMSKNDVKSLLSEGMFIGSHTYNHFWLSSMDYIKQKEEINLSIKFLNNIGAENNNWIMCYPYGDYNKMTLEILKTLNCLIGVTTMPGSVNLKKDKRLELNRVDIADFKSL